MQVRWQSVVAVLDASPDVAYQPVLPGPAIQQSARMYAKKGSAAYQCLTRKGLAMSLRME